MKWKMLCLFSAVSLSSISAQATQGIEETLSSVSVFSFGLNGFVARKMPQQMIYEEAVKNEKSTAIFERILQNPASTPEGKAYAACGLWENKALNKIYLNKMFEKSKVTVLKGDILRKEDLASIINGIISHGCQ